MVYFGLEWFKKRLTNPKQLQTTPNAKLQTPNPKPQTLQPIPNLRIFTVLNKGAK